jgi:glucokinase
VQDGRPFKGSKGNAILLASSPVTAVCTHCGAKLRPVLEEFASGPAIAKRFALTKSGRSAKTCEDVVLAASTGNNDAIEILSSAGEALGVGLAFLVNLLDPEMMVVGGGLGVSGGLYWDSFERSCREHIFADDSRGIPIVAAKLGTDAGLVGAAAVVLTQRHNARASYAYDSN